MEIGLALIAGILIGLVILGELSSRPPNRRDVRE